MDLHPKTKAPVRELEIEVPDEPINPVEPVEPLDNQLEGGEEEKPEEGLEEYNDDGWPFYTKLVNRYPKSSIWFFLILGLCIMRAASTFVIVMAFLSLVTRVVQVVGFFIPGKASVIVSYVGFGITAAFYFLMLGGALVIG